MSGGVVSRVDLPAFQHQRHRPVIDERHLHVGAERPTCHRRPQPL